MTDTQLRVGVLFLCVFSGITIWMKIPMWLFIAICILSIILIVAMWYRECVLPYRRKD